MENEEKTIVIPEFTKEQFLTSTDPFEWILSVTKGDAFKQKQLVTRVAQYAREKCKISNFTTMFKDFITSKRGGGLDSGNVMEFSGTALMWNTGEWTANDDGVYKRTGNGVTVACPHPIFIVARYTNVDSDAESVELVYGRYGRDYRTKIVPRSVLASSRKIVDALAGYGVGVTSENAKYLVQFLSDFESINYDKIADMKSCDHLGWVGSGYKQFAPYISDLEFEGKDMFSQLFKAVRESGSKDKWLAAMRNYRKSGNVIVRIVIAASFASVLLKPLGALPFFVHMWGDTETGKSVALMAAASVWADPMLGRFARSFDATAVGNEEQAACLNSLPMCIDELQILDKRADFDDIIYRLCEGVGRLRGKADGGVRAVKTWHNCFITTGERPITSMSSGGGAVNRVIEMECSGAKFFEDPRAFVPVIQNNYGYAGKTFVDELTRDNNIETARSVFARFIKRIETETQATDKQTASAAAILTADALAEKWIFKDGKTLDVRDIEPFLQTKDMLNAGKRAYEYLRGEVAANMNSFAADARECWGAVKDGCVYILKNRFNTILSDGDFNPQAALSWMARNGKVTKHDKGRRDKTFRVNGNLTKCVCIYADDGGEFEDIEDIDYDDLPFE